MASIAKSTHKRETAKKNGKLNFLENLTCLVIYIDDADGEDDAVVDGDGGAGGAGGDAGDCERECEFEAT